MLKFGDGVEIVDEDAKKRIVEAIAGLFLYDQACAKKNAEGTLNGACRRQ